MRGVVSVDLRARLAAVEADLATGRLDVAGDRGGRVYLDRGRVVCAEQHGQPTMLLAMAEAGLFTPEDWAAALKAPLAARWRMLVHGDDERLGRLVDFARAFVAEQLLTLVRSGAPGTTFVPDAAHPLGPLASWTVVELLGAHAAPPAIDRAEFLDLLSEISPHVARPAPPPEAPSPR